MAHDHEETARGIAPVVSGDRLRAARALRAMTLRDLSAALGGAPTATALSQFENESARPRAKNLAAIADVLAVPVAFFARDPSAEVSRAAFFRSLRKTTARQRDEAAAQAHLVYLFAQAIEDYVRLPELRLDRHPLPLDAEPAEAAGIAIRVRKEWGVPAGPIPNVVELLEANGIVVVRLAGVNENIDAFSIATPRPVVVLGAQKGDAARSRFDAAHEPAHLFLHDESACGDRHAEAQAHAFAAEFLMPADDIAYRLPRTLDWRRFVDLKFEWGVSIAALVRRAHDLGRMDARTYQHAVRTISARGWRKPNGEPGRIGPPEEPTMLVRACSLARKNGHPVGAIAERVGLPLADVEAFLEATADQRPTVTL
jgi:Zn-dependent peptidase ImmA (M78 family)/transcriptional regulator with XRE-family HTH domain